MTDRGSYRYMALICGLGLLTVLLFCLSLAMGQQWISPLVFFQEVQDVGQSSQMVDRIILYDIRLPRALLGLLIGMILGLSGAVLQGLLRNPLAEPGLLGISASASLGAVLAIHLGWTSLFAYALPVSALLCALIAVFVLFLLVGRAADILTIILAGVALTSLAGAMTSLTLNLSSNPFAALEIVFWMLGSLADRSLLHVSLAAPFILIGMVLLFSTARALDALSLGEDVAQTLGIRLGRTKSLAIFGTAIGVGAATAVSGAIGFVGLIIPHLLRPLVGNKPSRLLFASALGGASFLLAADCFVRFAMPLRDLKLGVVTALIGAPFFFWLLLSLRGKSR
ncbi:MAG: iron ABC transporter permease [Cohaesibacter sp.]|nr:iron ABC transporter permease [Cohaesibacter sp.]